MSTTPTTATTATTTATAPSLPPVNRRRIDTAGTTSSTTSSSSSSQSSPSRRHNNNNNNNKRHDDEHTKKGFANSVKLWGMRRSSSSSTTSMTTRPSLLSSLASHPMFLKGNSSNSNDASNDASNTNNKWNHCFRRQSTASLSSSSCSSLNHQHSNATEKATTDVPEMACPQTTNNYQDTTDYTDESSSEEAGLFETMSLLPPSATATSLHAATTCSSTSRKEPLNVMQWLSTTCPPDVVPHVLAFTGPKMTHTLSRVSQEWHETVQAESTWRVLCHDLYKWSEPQEEPTSWKKFYCDNPCVPIDYPTIEAALKANTGENVTVWVRPGRYHLKQGIDINRSPRHKVSIKTMKLPANLYQPPPPLPGDDARSVSSQNTHSSSSSKKRKGFLKFILCTAASYHEGAVDHDDDLSVASADNEQNHEGAAWWPIAQAPTRATLVLRTKRANEPVLRVQRGTLTATNLNIEHSCHGLDIWNGNAAIQVQPPQPDPQQEGPPPALRRSELPVAHLSGLKVTSRTGRGVVTIDGGQLTLVQSRVHQCAATGVYIGGRGTRAQVRETDVLRNGLGSAPRQSHRRGAQGIARGHSGIYLEQGVVQIVDCNVSNNTLTGLTAVSTENVNLRLANSDLQGNGSYQLEIPSRHARGFVLQQNRLESEGTGRVRATQVSQY